jgi:signal transduction histidine kinase
MRRIRIALALASLAALGLVALLAWRANQGLAAERAMRHRAVAERVFEEMERSLSEFLAREEARPFEDYAYASPATGARSPLAAGLEPFVVGAFQIDPEGRLTTPLDPADAAVARVRAALDGLWAAGANEEKDEGAAARQAATQAPGTTRALGGPGVKEEPQAIPEAPAPLRKREIGAYDALESLNRAADDRAARKQKVAQVAPSAVYGEGLADAAKSAPREEAELRSEDSFAAGAPPAKRSALARSDRDAPAQLRIAFDPMIGVAGRDDQLVLYRTVLVGERGYRQGLVLDRGALGAWLTERVFRSDPSGLARLAALHFGESSASSEPGREWRFEHRFAEPFDALHGTLALATLPGAGSLGALYAFAALLLALGAAGLFAVYRTVAVVVHFAERRSNFAAAVTHELKTPLTAIRMYAEMLRDGLVPSDAKRQEYYATITGESERLSRLVDNVLEFSKLEGGRRELAIAVGPVGPVLEDAAEKLAPHAASLGFALAVRVAGDLPAVRFDRDALLQVLFNLVDNAMKYAKSSDRRTVELEARREGDAVMVAVRDFGPGVARAHLEHVFEPFYRGESELTRTTKGTGIGLALVKELAERMGAAVSGANADGGGFRVRLAFPVA